MAEELGALLVVLQGADAGDGFDPADAGGYRLLAHDFQHADVAYTVDVGAAA